MEGAPFGWPHRQKRSLAQMQGNDRSASPAWAFDHLHNPHEQPLYAAPPGLHHSPPPRAFDYQDDRIPHRRHDPNPHIDFFYSPPHPPASMPNLYADSARPTPPLDNARLPHVAHVAAQTPRRFAGDGFDYRRPAGRASLHAHEEDVEDEAEDDDEEEEEEEEEEGGIMVDLSGPEYDSVIDLTADDSGYGASQDGNMSQHLENARLTARHSRGNHAPRRLPRGMDIIIDLDSGQEEWREAAPGSPEIEFISARPLEPHQRRPPAVQHGNREVDDVQFVREQPLPEDEQRRRANQTLDQALDLLGTLNGRVHNLRGYVERVGVQIIGDMAERQGRTPIPPPRIGSRRDPRPGQVRVGHFVAPTLDFGMIGFDMVNMGGARAPEPPPPTYDAPTKAPDGFTRSPVEVDVLACPNCGDELCVGDDDTKKQVWVIKGCGHVYCGECTANRTVKKSSKGKERPPNTKPFKICVVEDCDKSVVNRKSMIQVFL
ncbi:hypothetical protein NX059_010753 [Plenodomus lindquistii]|nr:hypothetical protein NX059_010753 [Plenodomus lindquistii]